MLNKSDSSSFASDASNELLIRRSSVSQLSLLRCFFPSPAVERIRPLNASPFDAERDEETICAGTFDCCRCCFGANFSGLNYVPYIMNASVKAPLRRFRWRGV